MYPYIQNIFSNFIAHQKGPYFLGETSSDSTNSTEYRSDPLTDDAMATTAYRRALTSDDADVCMHETNDAFQPPIGEHFDEFIESEQSEHDSMDVEIQANEEPSILQIQKAAARFLLTLKEQHRLTQVAVNFLVSQVKEIVECIVKDVKTMVAKVLVENSFVSSDDDLQCFDKCYENRNPFTDLETEYRQKKFYKTHFNLVVSIIIAVHVWPCV